MLALLPLVLVACEEERPEPDWPDHWDEDDTAVWDTGDTGVPDDARPVTVPFTGWAATVVGTPFGSADIVRDLPCTGHFTYDLAVVDQEPDRPAYGLYDHADRRSAAFTLEIAGHTVEGSHGALTEVLVGDSTDDTWRYVDGPQIGDDTWRKLRFDGADAEDARLWVSLTLAGGTFTTDAQPAAFPTLADVSSIENPHTFSLDTPQGSMLLQLYSIGG
jgi:hypothetical protein